MARRCTVNCAVLKFPWLCTESTEQPIALFQKRHERYLTSHKQAFTTTASRLTIEINFTKSFGMIRNRSLDVAVVGGLVHEGS